MLHLKFLLIFAVAAIGTRAFAIQEFDERTYSIPVTEANGNVRQLHTRACFPKGAASSHVVIVNHGSPPDASDRPSVMPYQCTSEMVQWFLSKGYAVLAPVRRGYGDTGGKWAESFGACDHPNFAHAGLETARDILAVANFVPNISNTKSDNITVVGQSAGGWGTIALDSMEHAHVSAIINMAGGRGGHRKSAGNCAPDELVKTAARFASTSTTPMLWIYSENDTYFPPALSKSMYDAYSKAGGKAAFVLKPPFGNDGHKEFTGKGGSLVWGTDVENYLKERIKQ